MSRGDETWFLHGPESARIGPFALREYDRAGDRSWFEAADALLTAYSPWLQSVDRVDGDYVRPTTVHVDGSPNIVFDTTHVEASGLLPIADVIAGDMSSIVDAIDAQAEAEARALEAMLLEHYRTITEATSHVMETDRAPLTHELIRELVAKMEVDFDDQGNPQLEFVITNRGIQSFAQLEAMTVEEDAAWNAVVEDKRHAWAARRRRRLVVEELAIGTPREGTTSAAPPFRMPEYDNAAAPIIFWYLDARSSDFAPSLKLFPRVAVQTVRPSTVRSEADEQVTIEPLPLRTAVIPDYAAIVAGSRDTLQATLDDLARSRAERLVAFWEINAQRMPGAGGIHPGIQPLTWDRLMDAMEAAALGFDDDGSPTMQVVAGPEAAALGTLTPTQARRLDALLDRKREEYRARRRRRLVA